MTLSHIILKQKEYEKMMKNIGWPNPGIVGYSFMEKYSHLFVEN